MTDVIKACIEQVKGAKYKPSGIWVSLDGKVVYIPTQDIDLSKYAKLIKKLK